MDSFSSEQVARDTSKREGRGDASWALGSGQSERKFASPLDRRASRRTSHHVESSADSLADEWVRLMLVLSIVGCVLAIGTIHAPTLLVATAVCVATGTLAIWTCRTHVHRWPVTLPVGVVVVATAFTLMQAIGLPAGWVAWLASNNAEVWSHALDPLGQPGPRWHPISLDPGATWSRVLHGVCYVSVLLAATVVGFRRRARYVVSTVFVSALLAGAVTLAHGLFGVTKVFGVYQPVHTFAVWHIGPLLNANHLAGYLNLGAMCGLGLLIRRRQTTPRWLIGFGVAVLVGLTVSTASRAAVLLMPLGVLVLLLMHRWHYRTSGDSGGPWTRALMLLVVGYGVVLAALGLTTKQWDELLTRDLSKLSILSWARQLVWDHRWLGIGRGAFETVYPAYRPTFGHELWTHPENLWVQWASEWGVVFAALVMVCFAWILRPRGLGATRSSAAAGAMAGIWILVAQNVVDFSLEIPGVTVAVIALLGACWAEARTVSQCSRGRAKHGEGFASCGLRAAYQSIGAAVGRWFSRMRRRDGARKGGIGRERDAVMLRKARRTTVVAMVLFAAVGACGLAVAARRIMPTALEERLAFGKYAVNTKLSKQDFRNLLRDAMLRHPAEAFLPLAGAERSWRMHEGDPLPFLERALTRASVYGRAHFLLAEVLFTRNATSQAMMELKYACRDEKALVSSAIGLALHHGVQGSGLDRLVPDEGRYPDQALTVLDTLGAWMHERDAKVADDFDRRAMQLDPNRLAPRERYGYRVVARLQQSGLDEAQRKTLAENVEAQAAWLRRMEPRKSRGLRLEASLHVAQGRVMQADELLSKGCDEVTDRYVCMKARVPILVQLGQADALREWLNATAIAGCTGMRQCVESYRWLADFHQARNNAGGAVNALAKLTRYDSADAKVWERLGDLNMGLGLFGQATRSYEKAVKLRPDDAQLRGKLDTSRGKLLPGLLQR